MFKSKTKSRKSKLVKKPNLVFLLFFLLTPFLLLILYAQRGSFGKYFWTNYKSIKAIPFGGADKFVIYKDRDSSFSLLPQNYQQKRKDFNLTIINKNNKKKTSLTPFKDLLEFNNIKILSDESPILWLIIERNEECSWNKSFKDKNSCSSEVFSYDPNSNKKKLEFSTPDYHLSPLVLDSDHFNIWFVDQEKKTIIRFNFKNNKVSYSKLDKLLSINDYLWSPYSNFLYKRAKIADTDKDGNLYYLTEPPFGIERKEGQVYASQLGVLNLNEQKSTYLDFSKITYANAELAIDKTNNLIYLVNNSWDSNTPSDFYVYSINKNSFRSIGQIPTRSNDDVRGIEVVEGKLLAGFWDGLGIYSPDKNSWEIITKKGGLHENAVSMIYKINDQVCVEHENENLDCLRFPFYLYSLIN